MAQVVNFSATDVKSIDFRTGLNFTIGKRDASGIQRNGSSGSYGKGGKTKGVSTGSFLGELNQDQKTKRHLQHNKKTKAT